ncbi:RibD/RibG domain protein [Desmospora sp. 8437]|uniref:Uncharacterized protein n=1 Tax=Kroppenstedtia eburnea TaxID=714067 RepID=A0A1N7N143_9BACL|nr:RibD/RibG domain protein [Desmospora sp. 8437]SIS92052.1 hypothetical protein SAMN05421790_107183 [Kroppenstedtia eburnea]
MIGVPELIQRGILTGPFITQPIRVWIIGPHLCRMAGSIYGPRITGRDEI